LLNKKIVGNHLAADTSKPIGKTNGGRAPPRNEGRGDCKKAFMTAKHTDTSDTTNIPGVPPAAESPSAQQDGAQAAAGKPETETGSTAMTMLNEHKGKLAIGVAATLGAMIYYGWRQKQLSKEDPEGYARLQRIRDSMKEDGSGKSAKEKPRSADQSEKKNGKS
jgi:hypothetical protein